MVDIKSRGPGGRQAGRAALQAWPAHALIGAVLGAALFAFSPRPHPVFPETEVRPDNMLVTGLAREGSRLVAVGEQGRVFTADSAEGPWSETPIEPQRGSTLSAVRFVGEGVAVAVGHDSWIVRSEDGGRSWQEVFFDPERSEALLGVAGPFDGKLFAFGAFGQFLTSVDQGRSWQRGSLAEAGKGGVAEAAAPAPDPNADPFANAASAASGISDRHLNAMARAPDGSLIVVGERGLIAKSNDGGASWRTLPEIYAGSFYGVLVLPSNRLLVFGMRGHAFYSDDLGQTWHEAGIPGPDSLYAGAVAEDGAVMLAGANNTVLISRDGGANFKRVSQVRRRGLAALLPLSSTEWLGGGEDGLEREQAVGGE